MPSILNTTGVKLINANDVELAALVASMTDGTLDDAAAVFASYVVKGQSRLVRLVPVAGSRRRTSVPVSVVEINRVVSVIRTEQNRRASA